MIRPRIVRPMTSTCAVDECIALVTMAEGPDDACAVAGTEAKEEKAEKPADDEGVHSADGSKMYESLAE